MPPRSTLKRIPAEDYFIYRDSAEWWAPPKHGSPLHGDHVLALNKTMNPAGTPLVWHEGRLITWARLAYRRVAGRWPESRLARLRWCDYPRCITHWDVQRIGRKARRVYYQTVRRARLREIAEHLRGAPLPALLHWRRYDVFVYTPQMQEEGVPEPALDASGGLSAPFTDPTWTPNAPPWIEAPNVNPHAKTFRRFIRVVRKHWIWVGEVSKRGTPTIVIRGRNQAVTTYFREHQDGSYRCPRERCVRTTPHKDD